MKEIKFRAWAKNIKKMFYSSSVTINLDGDIVSTYGVYDKGLILLQYTGLKDSKNREIYEGDILGDVGCEETNIDGIVKWMDDRGAYYLVDKEGYVTDSDYCYEGLDWNKLEVIGNIYMNPELLKIENEV